MSEKVEGVKPLKEIRLNKFWSIRTLASNATISTDAVMRAERGDRVQEVTQYKIADALGVRVDQVAEFTSEGKKGADNAI